jgi:hypothetical protein
MLGPRAPPASTWPGAYTPCTFPKGGREQVPPVLAGPERLRRRQEVGGRRSEPLAGVVRAADPVSPAADHADLDLEQEIGRGGEVEELPAAKVLAPADGDLHSRLRTGQADEEAIPGVATPRRPNAVPSASPCGPDEAVQTIHERRAVLMQPADAKPGRLAPGSADQGLCRARCAGEKSSLHGVTDPHPRL